MSHVKGHGAMLSLSLTYTFGIPSEENESEKKDHNFFGSRNVSLKMIKV